MNNDHTLNSDTDAATPADGGDRPTNTTEADAAGAHKSKRTKAKANKKVRADSQVTTPKRTKFSKGVETMYRSAYRAELGLITLAATKANIMISLNGFIISVVIVSGGLLLDATPVVLVPVIVFLFTSAASAFFAVLAASPERTSSSPSLTTLFRAAIYSKPGGVRGRPEPGESQSDRETPRPLIYDERSLMDYGEFQAAMDEVRKDDQLAYDNMDHQLYWLGQMAATKFRMLNISYGVFRWGLVLSAVTFIGLKSAETLLTDDGPQLTAGFAQFDDIYEPSAGVQLPDGRVLLVEDEQERALNILSYSENGEFSENQDLGVRLTDSLGRRVADLEGLTIDSEGNIFGITSHSANRDGERTAEREQLVRFRIDGDSLLDIAFYTDFRDQVVQSTEVQRLLADRIGQTVEIDDINVEGLTFDLERNVLLVGFREPVIRGRSLVLVVGNPVDIFEMNAAPEFTDLALLEMEGGGIRSMSYDPILGRFLLVNEVESPSGANRTRLWSWSGRVDSAPEELFLPGVINLENVESIDSVTIEGRSWLMLSSDDGDIDESRPASYMLLSYDQIDRPRS